MPAGDFEHVLVDGVYDNPLKDLYRHHYSQIREGRPENVLTEDENTFFIHPDDVRHEKLIQIWKTIKLCLSIAATLALLLAIAWAWQTATTPTVYCNTYTTPKVAVTQSCVVCPKFG